MPYQEEIKAIKLLQARSNAIGHKHQALHTDLESIKASLANLGTEENAEFLVLKQKYLDEMTSYRELKAIPISEIYKEAEVKYKTKLGLADILSLEDFQKSQQKVDDYVRTFNKKYSLDAWDYAIAGSCGLFAAMLHIFCVAAPMKPTTEFNAKVNGIFNQWVQSAFNSAIPPELSAALSKEFGIGAPDTSVISNLIGAAPKTIAPINHRFRALSHDPILGIFFGIYDMINGTCTVVNNGTINSIPSTKGTTDGNIFQLIGKMIGHLLSDVNAPSANGNRGMGLPAPFMGLFGMLRGVEINGIDIGKQFEWLYIQGYDFRQFTATSISMLIMEALMRVFYCIKQVTVHKAAFGKTLLDTMPLRLNPRFRIMLALAYGTSSAVNSGEIYIGTQYFVPATGMTNPLLKLNYASWMGFTYNSFFALKWALKDRQNKLWNGITEQEIMEIENLNQELDKLALLASLLVG